MTKERELLRECYFYIDNKIDASPKSLLLRIDELLAQPEQEPVAWLLSSKDSSYTELIKTEPEGADIYLYQINPLYTSPPKREPLSDGTTVAMWHANKKATHADSYWAGVSDAEKSHGIGVDDE